MEQGLLHNLPNLQPRRAPWKSIIMQFFLFQVTIGFPDYTPR